MVRQIRSRTDVMCQQWLMAVISGPPVMRYVQCILRGLQGTRCCYSKRSANVMTAIGPAVSLINEFTVITYSPSSFFILVNFYRICRQNKSSRSWRSREVDDNVNGECFVAAFSPQSVCPTLSASRSTQKSDGNIFIWETDFHRDWITSFEKWPGCRL